MAMSYRKWRVCSQGKDGVNAENKKLTVKSLAKGIESRHRDEDGRFLRGGEKRLRIEGEEVSPPPSLLSIEFPITPLSDRGVREPREAAVANTITT